MHVLDDEKYMRRCLSLARLGAYYVAPNPMVGAVLVDDCGTVLAEGWHRRYGEGHAEVNCFREAEERGISEEAIHRATLYVSLEPCSHYGKTPPCAELIIRKRPACVVAGMLDPNPQVSGRGIRMIEEAGIPCRSGVLEAECRELNKRFLCLHEKHRPYVLLKWAQTADGYLDNRTAEGGRPLPISSPFTKRLVHELRAENMAILVGARTIRMDHPKLRTSHWAGRDPLRIALDHHPEGQDYTDWLVYSDETDWEAILADLARRNIHSLVVEGGRQVLESLLRSGLYDEVHIEQSPLLAGSGTPAPQLNTPRQLIKTDEKQYENQILITYRAL